MGKKHEQDLRIVQSVVDAQLAERDAEIAGLRSALADTVSALADATSENYMREVVSVNERDAEIARLRQQVAELEAWKASVPVSEIVRYTFDQYDSTTIRSSDDWHKIRDWIDVVSPE